MVGVHTVLCDGEVVLAGGEFTRVDGPAELRSIDDAAKQLARRTRWLEYAAEHAPSRWPVIGAAMHGKVVAGSNN